eukprot:g1194.t1
MSKREVVKKDRRRAKALVQLDMVKSLKERGNKSYKKKDFETSVDILARRSLIAARSLLDTEISKSFHDLKSKRKLMKEKERIEKELLQGELVDALHGSVHYNKVAALTSTCPLSAAKWSAVDL